jgi:hypothetical protein
MSYNTPLEKMQDLDAAVGNLKFAIASCLLAMVLVFAIVVLPIIEVKISKYSYLGVVICLLISLVNMLPLYSFIKSIKVEIEIESA